MGGGYWDAEAYDDAKADRAKRKVATFGYDAEVKQGKASGIHPDLDPSKVAGSRSPLAGRPVRESRDSDDHPKSIPIAVIFDVTGSMGKIPKTLQEKLPKLMDVILEKAQIADPQILIGAVGDSYSDKYPFQVGQFESDNRFDEQLRNLIIEGGGGGQVKESYALAWRFAADHTATDCFEKRKKKGYLFTMGDEAPWDTVTKAEVQRIFGIGAEIDEPIEALLKRAQERWNVFHLAAMDGSYPNNEDIHGRWTKLLGERYIKVDDSALICEVIAGVVNMCEKAVEVSVVLENVGLRGKAAATLAKALSGVSAAPSRPGVSAI